MLYTNVSANIDLSNDVSFMKIVHVVCDSRPERQNIMNTPRMLALEHFVFTATPSVTTIEQI